MNKASMEKYLLILGILGMAGMAHAQETAVSPGKELLLFSGPHFLAALLVGVILAIAFQLVLTSLSVAVGVSAIGPVTEKGDESKEGGIMEEGVMGAARKISTRFGLWALITTCIALFFASWLAVEISGAFAPLAGVVLGLGIWGLFYIAMTALQVSAVSSLVGFLINAATSGLRSIGQEASSLFGKSEEKAAETATQIMKAVHEEVFGNGNIRDQIQNYIDQLKPKSIDIKQIREELAKLLDETELQTTLVRGEYDSDRLVATLKTKYGSAWEDTADRVKGAATAVKEEMTSGKSTAEKVVDVGMRIAGLSKEEAENTRQKVENYLRRTGKEALDPEHIKQDIERLVSNPEEGKEVLQARLAQIDKSTMSAVLAQREDLTREEAEKVVDTIDRMIHELRQGAQATQEGLDAAKDLALAKVRIYLDSLNRPELKYEGVRNDILRLFREPKEGFEALINRFKAMDRNTLKALISSHKGISEQDAEHIISQIESARDQVISNAEQMKAEAQRRLQQAKEQSLRQAEEARMTAAVASWWTFATVVVSGAVSVVGGLVAFA